MADTSSVWGNYPLVCWQLLHWVPMKAWCSESQGNSILFTKLPETFRNHFTGVSMVRKQVTQKDLLRGQLESVLSNYKSAAFLPISSSESQQIQRLEEKNKRTHGKSPVSKWECLQVLLCCVALVSITPASMPITSKTALWTNTM